MNVSNQIILIYLAVINVATFFTYGIDKWKAKKSKWRIRETALLGLAVLGGSIGAWLGMKVWHHKTMHKKFKYGIPTIIIVQILLIGLFVYGFQSGKRNIRRGHPQEYVAWVGMFGPQRTPGV